MNEGLKVMKGEKLDSRIDIRISKGMKAWLDKNDYSPTLIFRRAVEKLGYKKK